MIDKDTFLIDKDEVSMAALNGDTQHVEAEIVSSVEDFHKMSLAAVNEQKKALAAQKTQVMLSTDAKKLEEIKQVNTALDSAFEAVTNPEMWERLANNAKTPMDFKFLTEGMQKLMDMRKNLIRLDSIDGEGHAREVHIGVRYQDDNNGTKVDTVIKVGD